MNKLLILVPFLFLFNNSVFTQCGDDIFELALLKVGNDVVLIRDFKVKLREGNKRNPLPSVKFSVFMQKGLSYRFVVLNDKMANTVPILQLFDRSQLLGSTYDLKSDENKGIMEFVCSRTGSYQVNISNKDVLPGCAIGLMAMITDSAFYAQGNVKHKSDKHILYAGIENQLNIITDQEGIKRVEVIPDRGNIYRKDSVWYAFVHSPGPIKIAVKLYNMADTIIEEIIQDFSVIPVPQPKVTIEGSFSDYIMTGSLPPTVKLNISPDVYKIMEFYISLDLSYNEGFQSSSEYLTPEMVSFIKSLQPHQRFYIKNIHIIGPGGKSQIIGPFMYSVR